jgi:hypothetical protein
MAMGRSALIITPSAGERRRAPISWVRPAPSLVVRPSAPDGSAAPWSRASPSVCIDAVGPGDSKQFP